MASYEPGLREVGDGCWAYMQPDGAWGRNNAGLISDGESSLRVDTLFDTPLTAPMLATIRAAVPAARTIGTGGNTHANGDHGRCDALVRAADALAPRP